MEQAALPEGLVGRRSADSFGPTLARLEAAFAPHGLTVFARIDHAAAAQAVGLHLPPTVVFVVGAATAGTRLMAERPWLAIDLPLRILVREQEPGGAAEVGFNDPAWFVARHGVDSDAPEVIGMRRSLSAILAAATGSQA
jgi:uncharacterized protein (DUF302 family)